MPEIDNLSISISASAAAAIAELDKLASSLTRFSGASRKVKTSANEVEKGMEDVASSTQKAATNTSTLADKLGKLQSALSKTAPKFKELASAAVSIGRVSFSPVTSALGSLGNAAKSAYSSVTGLFSTISRIAFYRLIRTAIKMVTQALSEGIKTLYHYSETFSGTFYQSMNSIATSANYVKNSIAAMVSPLITAVTPVLTSIADKIVDVFNLINQFIARLTGQSTYTAAKKVSTLWDDATKKTAASTQKANSSASKSTKDTAKGISDTVKKTADEIKRYTLGFDELNILGKNKDNGGADSGAGGGSSGGLGDIALPTSSGASSSGTDYGSLFETRKIDGAVSDFADAIRQAFENQDWQGLGSLIGNKINSALDSVNWSGIGRKVGTALNGVIETAYYLLDTINFTNIGKHIAEFLNNAIEQINFNTLGRLMIKKMTIIPDMIIGFLVEFDWGQAAAKLSDFAIGCFEEITKWFRKYNWAELGGILYQKLEDIFTHIKYGEIANAFFTALDAALESGIGLLSGFFDGLANRFKKSVNWDSMTEDVKRAITSVMGLAGIAMGAVGAILTFSGINPGLGIPLMIAGGFAAGTAASLKWDGLSNKIDEVIKIVKAVVYPASFVIGCVLAFSGTNIPLGLGMMIAGAAGTYKTVKENWAEIYNKLRSPIGLVEALLSGALLTLGVLSIVGGRIGLGLGLVISGSAGLAGYFAANWDIIKQKLQGPIGTVTKIISDALLVLGVMALVGGRFGLGLGLIIAGASGLAGYATANWDVLKQKLQGPIGVITGILEAAKLVLGILAIMGGHFGLGIGLIISGAAGLATTIGVNWDNLKNLGETAVKKVQEGWNAAKNFVIDIKNDLYKLGSDAAKSVKKGWDAASDFVLNTEAKNNQNSGGVQSSTTSWRPDVDLSLVKRKLEVLFDKYVDFDVKVELVKDSWTTVAEWVNQSRGGNNDQLVELKRAGWTFIDSWAKLYQGGHVTKFVVLEKLGWNLVSSWVEGSMGWIVSSAVGLTKYGWSWVSSWVQSSIGGTVYQGVSLFINNWSSFVSTVSGALSGLRSWLGLAEGGAIEHGKVSRFAGGGVIHAYAGGTSSAHGSLFLAGEAGPEIVGHVGGRTEVLNKSQLAATMYSAVNAAMAPAAANFANAAAYMYQGANGYTEDDMETLIQLVRTGSEATERQNELLRQQNEYLRQINAKEFTTEISTADINRAQARSNRRAGTTIVPMTT